MSLAVPVMLEVENNKYVPSRRGSKSSTESQFSTKMYLYGREICFLLAIIFTSYAALQNGSPKVSKLPAAVPFFPRSTYVTDFYQGQLGSAFEKVSESDVAFVMYYAPWDAESQIVRAEFLATARFYHKQVYFAGINCWQPLSDCRLQFSKIQAFPVLIAYAQHSKGVQYKGLKEAAHMIAFLRHVLTPLDRVNTRDDLEVLRAKHDAVVVGSFRFLGNVGSPGFHTFYLASLKHLERDPLRDIAFAVRTSSPFSDPDVSLHLWNETIVYPASRHYTAESVAQWLGSKVHQVAVWLAPPGVKAATLAPYVEDGAVLMLFAPRHPLWPLDHAYTQLREAGLLYYDCSEDSGVNDLAMRLAALPSASRASLSALQLGCASEQTTVVSVAANDSCQRGRHLLESCCSVDIDPRSAAGLQRLQRLDRCRLSRLLPPPPAPPPGPAPLLAGVRGLACRTNHTLSLLAMDSLQYAHFASALGIDVLSRPSQTAAVVVSVQDESVFELPGVLDLPSLIVAHSEGRLNRTLRSGGSTFHRQGLALTQVTSRTFQRIVMDNTQAVLLLYHSPLCAPCAAISHILLAASRLFSSVDNLTFARIDGENNDLPWELTMHRYPTILFFPAKRKSESRVFPHSLAVTVPNVVRFVLSNLDASSDRLRGLIGLCSRMSDRRQCLTAARSECLSAISDTLARYKPSMSLTSYAQLLARLQHLRQVHLLLTEANDLAEGSRQLDAIRDSFRTSS